MRNDLELFALSRFASSPQSMGLAAEAPDKVPGRTVIIHRIPVADKQVRFPAILARGVRHAIGALDRG
jgi:hypothetical protein